MGTHKERSVYSFDPKPTLFLRTDSDVSVDQVPPRPCTQTALSPVIGAIDFLGTLLTLPNWTFISVEGLRC